MRGASGCRSWGVLSPNLRFIVPIVVIGSIAIAVGTVTIETLRDLRGFAISGRWPYRLMHADCRETRWSRIQCNMPEALRALWCILSSETLTLGEAS